MNVAGPVICDTSGLVAAVDTTDPDHRAAAEVLARADGPFVVSSLVVTETDHLLRARLTDDAARTFADDIAAGAYELAPLTTSDLATCLDVDRRYADLGLGLADAHLVVLAAAYRTDLIMTLNERHLRAIRPLRGPRAFRLLPADR